MGNPEFSPQHRLERLVFYSHGHICAELNKRIMISLFYYGQLDLSNIHRTVVCKSSLALEVLLLY